MSGSTPPGPSVRFRCYREVARCRTIIGSLASGGGIAIFIEGSEYKGKIPKVEGDGDGTNCFEQVVPSPSQYVRCEGLSPSSGGPARVGRWLEAYALTSASSRCCDASERLVRPSRGSERGPVRRRDAGKLFPETTAKRWGESEPVRLEKRAGWSTSEIIADGSTSPTPLWTPGFTALWEELQTRACARLRSDRPERDTTNRWARRS